MLIFCGFQHILALMTLQCFQHLKKIITKNDAYRQFPEKSENEEEQEKKICDV